jgi:hypothetical protein
VTCTPINLGNGNVAIVCTRGGRPRTLCSACKSRVHELLCDHPLAGKLVGRTCSAKLCRRCATHVDGKDLCPPHARAHAAQTTLVLR